MAGSDAPHASLAVLVACPDTAHNETLTREDWKQEQGPAPEMSSPWLGCSMTVLTAARDWYSRWHPGARRSQIRTVPSSEPEYIHLLSF